jgi:carbonic anhydrase
MQNDQFKLNRGAFLAGSLAAVSLALPQGAHSAERAAPTVAPDEALAQLMAGNAHFVHNEFPPLTSITQKRALLENTQTPFAAVLTCADSRVIPEFIFIQGLGQLFVVRVAGNFPDGLVLGSLEYAVEHLGTRLVMVLGHQNCGAVTAVYKALQSREDLPKHLNSMEELMAPGIAPVVKARGTIREAVEANVRAATALLRATPPVIEEDVDSRRVRVVGAYYQLRDGKVTLID